MLKKRLVGNLGFRAKICHGILWRKTAEQGAERFMAKWIAAEKVRAGLRHALYSVPERDGRTNDRIAQSKQRVRAGPLAIGD